MKRLRPVLAAVILVALVAAGWLIWRNGNGDALPEGFARGNGRIEAVEIDVAARAPGRIERVLVREADPVTLGQPLVELDTRQLRAALHQAEAEHRRAGIAVENARLGVEQARAEARAAEAVLAQRQADREVAGRQLARSQALAESSIASQRTLDVDRAGALGAEAAVAAAQAAIEAITVQIEDSTLKAPRAGRVQYIVAREGEVVGAGGRVINMIDLNDVYMTFFLPTAAAGRTGIGTEARILLDAAPGMVIPAQVSFVADVAQFTPKTVETEVEREKLMFRVRARVAPELLAKYLDQIKTGLPGVAWVRLDPAAPWPEEASGRVLE